jgi:Hsp70 protein/Domain of unknown function (DUF4388)
VASSRVGGAVLKVIGVDLGSSAVRAAVLVGAEPSVLRTPDGAEEIPACVSFAQGGTHVGQTALGFAVTHPQDTVCDVKRRLIAGAAGSAPRAPASIVALLLRRVVEIAKVTTGDERPSTVFAHPFTPNAALDAAVCSAAAEVELASVAFVAEPLAAASRLCATDHVRPVFIADIGASHSTVSVVEVGPDIEPRLLHAATAEVGGAAVTLALLERVTGKDPSTLPPGMGELLLQFCEQMKKDLSAAETAQCSVPPMFVQALGIPAELTANRATLEAASAPLLLAVEDSCARALGGSGLAHSDVELYVLGGAARSPLVSTLIERALGTRGRLSRASSVIAQGAAKLGAIKPPTRAVDDVRTRASWRPPPRAAAGQAPTSFVGRPASAATDVLRIPTARVPVIPGATPVPPPPSKPPSSPPSSPPSGTRLTMQSISASQLDSGHIHNALTVEDILALPIARPMRESDLEPVALPLLLLLLGSKRRTGTLTLHMDGVLPQRLAFVEGKVVASTPEVTALGERFKVPAGSYQFDEGRPEVGTRPQQSTATVVIAALRTLLRAFPEAALRSALRTRLEQAAEVTANDQLRLGSMGLLPLEMRAVKFSLNGKNTGASVVDHSGIGTHMTLSLLVLLEVFGFVTWRAADATPDRSLAQELEARAKALEATNYFQVLGVHWSATGVEIGEAYRKFREQLSETQPVFAAAPEACRRMLARAEQAYHTLSVQERRDAYRKKTFPDINFKGVEDLLEKKQRALEMKDSGEAREVQDRLQEIARARSKKPPPG